jgi:hypothetical protein
MQQAPPAVRDLARQILAQEAYVNNAVETPGHAVLLAIETLHLHLEKSFGDAGFQSLLARALSRAKTEVSWLQVARSDMDGKLEVFLKAASQLNADQVSEGEVALLTELLGLLFTFFGASLTLRLLQAE